MKNKALGTTPFASDEAIMDRTFYRRRGRPASSLRPAEEPEPEIESAVRTQAAKDKPTHYKIVSISLYNEDIDRLERMVADLKERGHRRANKSQLIRYALATVDLENMPKGF